MTRGRLLKELIDRPGILVVPGAFDAISARLVERAGFEACYMTGGGTAAAVAAIPDTGLLSLTEMATNARYIANAVRIPVLADADTGYGNAINVMRTVQEYERAGLAGLHLEDQVTPKRCGHVAGKECIPVDEMMGKIKAAIAARSDPDFVIVARTDSRAPLGFEEAVRRGRAYREAGADVIFPEALQSRDEFIEYAKVVHGPLLANMTEFGKTPQMTAQEFENVGYSIVIFAASAMRVALKAMKDFYTDLRVAGTQEHWLDRMMTRAEQYELVDYQSYTAHELDFLGRATDPLS